MRPVLLEMAGFAAFREHTVVDFRGAEYFALVGPTGSGKSTVIDALTFALYGSVPRWDNARTVALALAPTVGRGTVRFVFDAGRERYVVARELRRAASGSVSVRTARLERLRDPAGTGTAEEETEPLADGAAATTKAVEELLGLPFGDFTTCVVLPQGEFAEFLHTEPRKRQETLVRLLGLGVYDVIAKEANSEAKTQENRAQVLTEQLGSYADATEEAATAAAARVTELDALRERVAATGARLAAAEQAVTAAAAGVALLDGERAALAALSVPDGLDALTARRRDAVAALATATAEAERADAADVTARAALAAGPERGPLEQARREHAERAEVVAALPAAREQLSRARDAVEAAAKEAVGTREAVDAARAVRDTARAARDAAEEQGRRLRSERDALAAVTVPDGVGALAGRASAAASALAEADAELARAEEADAAARAAVEDAPDREPLARARRDVDELERARATLTTAHRARDAARAAAEQAGDAAADARKLLDHATGRHAAATRDDLAAVLRSGLVAGAECPVCAQEVAAPPAPLPAGALAAAEAEVDRARGAYEAAQAAEREAAARLSRADAGAVAAEDAVTRLATALAAVELPAGERAGAPTAADLDAALARLDALAAAARAADAAVRRARTARDAAATATERARREAAQAGAALRAARDPLVPLGAPAPDEEDVAAAWTALVGWAEREVVERDGALPAVREAFTRARTDLVTAEAALAEAERAADEGRRAETAAARAEQAADGTVHRLEQRERELDAALAGQPGPDGIAAELARLAALEDAARAADTAARTARSTARAAEGRAAAAERELASAWDTLRSARDPLVPLGAPAVTGDDLASAWAGLREWAAAERSARDARLVTAREAQVSAANDRDGVRRELVDDLAAHLDPAPTDPDPASAPAAVAAALERARAAVDRLAERRAAAASLLADRDAAVESQQVAGLLGRLLRSDGFPRWLVAAALDTLVADASASLAELSGGQFELTHDNGEFLVVDHADADARRPVKTLSGGETFQASLALALALSAQMSDLAAHGAARLESIFLDEGFGTLDEANLETVASTLETLATRGDRVVGVITHVPALAERVPVRFAVRRDQRTSSVVREGP